MQCLILAGGLGTRMKSIAGDLPKALLPLGSKTFIDYQLEWLKAQGISHVVMAIGYQGEALRDHIEAARLKDRKNSYPQVQYRFDGPELVGTGGAIRNSLDLLEDNFIVTYGDSFLLLNLHDLFDCHLNSKKGATMSIYKNSNQGDLSNVVYKSDGTFFYDKHNRTSEMEYIDYGMLVFQKRFFEQHCPQGSFDLSTLLAKWCAQGEVTAFVAQKKFYEIGSPDGYSGFSKLLASIDYDLKKLL